MEGCDGEVSSELGAFSLASEGFPYSQVTTSHTLYSQSGISIMPRYFSMDLAHAGYVAGPFSFIARVGIFLLIEDIFFGGGGIVVVLVGGDLGGLAFSGDFVVLLILTGCNLMLGLLLGVLVFLGMLLGLQLILFRLILLRSFTLYVDKFSFNNSGL